MKTGYKCTCYFKGIDGKGTCDDECQWWHGGICPCAKGSKYWDGKEHYLKETRGEKMNLSEIILSKLRQHHEGKENAIKRIKLLEYCQYFEPDLTDRELRNIYCQLPVISSEAGIFWPIRKEELDEFEVYCRKKALPLFIRVKMVMKEHEGLRAEKYIQKELW